MCCGAQHWGPLRSPHGTKGPQGHSTAPCRPGSVHVATALPREHPETLQPAPAEAPAAAAPLWWGPEASTPACAVRSWVRLVKPFTVRLAAHRLWHTAAGKNFKAGGVELQLPSRTFCLREGSAVSAPDWSSGEPWRLSRRPWPRLDLWPTECRFSSHSGTSRSPGALSEPGQRGPQQPPRLKARQ